MGATWIMIGMWMGWIVWQWAGEFTSVGMMIIGTLVSIGYDAIRALRQYPN